MATPTGVPEAVAARPSGRALALRHGLWRYPQGVVFAQDADVADRSRIGDERRGIPATRGYPEDPALA